MLRVTCGRGASTNPSKSRESNSNPLSPLRNEEKAVAVADVRGAA